MCGAIFGFSCEDSAPQEAYGRTLVVLMASAYEETNDIDQPLWNFGVEAKSSRVAIRAFTFRPRVSGRFSPTRYAVAVRSMWLALSSDLLSPAFQRELSLHHLGPVERQTLV
jgi:hypothetical protein